MDYNEFTYAQLIGPQPTDETEIETGTSKTYSDDTYGDLYNNGGFNIPWGWVLAGLAFVFILVGLFLVIRKKLLKKDRNEKAEDGFLMEVRVPKGNETEIGVAEKMFANLYGIGGKGDGIAEYFSVNNCVTFEMVGLPGEIRFYVHCSKKIAELVEKQILGSYQDADIIPVTEYNIFAPNTEMSCKRLVLAEDSYCPLKTAEDFTGDPMANILSTLSKMSENEGAVIQIAVSPAEKGWQSNGEKFVQRVQENNSDPEKKKIHASQEKLDGISKKIAKPGLVTEIRIVTSAPDKAIADMHLDNILSAFDQYGNPGINKLEKKKIKKKDEKKFLYDLIFRRTPEDEKSVLNVEELAGIYHFPNKDITIPNIRWLLAKELVADNTISEDIKSRDTIWIGNNIFRGKKRA
ncbi:MAG: hypothetical protein PHE21_02385, partial [Candidatus Dojkabacteria bacterium]|nr:hypothetical protein [Candidatus Dojkabacteria bacterium]